MRDRNSDDLTSWEQAFVSLNEKLGNDVWGVRQEPNGSGGFRLRIFINNASLKDKVLEETKGTLDGHALVFTIYSQSDYALSESRRAGSEKMNGKAEEHAKTETATRGTDGTMQGDSR